ncbi:hypothetical protein L7F22_055692 [Adiantum nelumboides]|nr:hypothetical protein [Adiantum nelumboides]
MTGFLSFLLCVLCLSSSALCTVAQSTPPPSSSSCPLNFTVLDELANLGNQVKESVNVTFRCTSFKQVLHVVLVEYVASTGFFLVPDTSASACWDEFDQKVTSFGISSNVRTLCNLTTSSIARSSAGCNNITSVQDLEKLVPQGQLSTVTQQCTNASTESFSLCSACTAAVSQTTINHLSDSSSGSINSCQDVMSLYASASAPNSSHDDVAQCLFNIADFSADGGANHMKYVYGGVGAAVTLLLVLGVALFFYIRRRKLIEARNKQEVETSKEKMAKSNSNLRWFTMAEIKAATNNFSRHNIVGTGGYGNVYRGTLDDGSEIAVKRFKNVSAAGDEEFFHELEVISSVRHRNLVALQGCCVDKTEVVGHQRIIVYDYMPNGSLHDHLFLKKSKMDWLRRQNIALGIVRGLSYLHQEVQPAIIHRDIKASNILLDANWNARVADFGLAKFTPEGATHVTTRVAGTQGYVAPEYVLYGQLTEKSDVYSFGVLLLELFTGRAILKTVPNAGEGSVLITDWVWSLVKQGKVLEALDPEMDDLGPSEIMERFILLALLCAHPQVPFRPTLDRVLKIMENDQPLPPLPDRPLAYTVDISDIEHVVGGPDALSSGSGFQCFSSRGSRGRSIK